VVETYVGVVGDNVRYNMSAFEKLRADYPTLFCLGCAAHCFDLLMEDLAKIKEYKEIIDAAVFIANFIRNHKTVCSRFKTLLGPQGKMVVSFPRTRFAYADLTIYRCYTNARVLERLVDADDWHELTTSIKASQIEKFESLISSDLFSKMESLHDLLLPVDKAIHHIEKCGAKLSWIYMLFSHVLHDIDKWADKASTKRRFSTDAISAATAAARGRWTGAGSRQVGLRDPLHVFGWLVDPFSTPTEEYLQQVMGWENECLKVLKPFYPDASDREAALDEIKSLIRRRGEWGQLINRKQELICSPEATTFKTMTEKLIFQQSKMTSVVDDWSLIGVKQFPKIAPIAIRVDEMSVQSADVERVCKVHKLIHTKARNRLYTTTVHRLLFTYINLRLLNQCTDELGDFLSAALSSCHDEGEDPLPAGPVGNTEDLTTHH
jgi:hypothetical protein